MFEIQKYAYCVESRTYPCIKGTVRSALAIIIARRMPDNIRSEGNQGWQLRAREQRPSPTTTYATTAYGRF